MFDATVAWERQFSAFKARVLPVFRRCELKQSGAAFLDGLLSGIERRPAG